MNPKELPEPQSLGAPFDPVQSLNDLRDAMRELLDVVSCNSSPVGNLHRMRERCKTLVERYQAECATLRDAPAVTEQLQAGLRDALRLNAIAVDLIQRKSEMIEDELAIVRNAQKHLAGRGKNRPDSGESVNIAG